MPRELVAAAGFSACRLWGDVAPDKGLPANLGPRAASLLSQALALPSDVVGLTITHGRAEDVQLFGVLRELHRLGQGPATPVHFLDLLHGQGEAVAAYNEARLRAFTAWLESLGGDAIDPAAVREQIVAGNARRRAVAGLFEMRAADPPTMSGVRALELVRHLARLGEDRHDAAIAEAQATPPRPAAGVRVLVTGSNHEDASLYAQIEAAGAVVIGEDHDGGDLWTQQSPVEGLLPLASLARRPQTAPFNGPTSPTDARVQALRHRVEQVLPAAVIHLRIDGDEAAPWDLAAIRAVLTELGVPLLALTVGRADGDRLQREVAAFLGSGPAAAAASSGATKQAAPAPGRRSRKVLTCTQDFTAWQRDWFASVRDQAAAGPFAVVNADAPQEILRAMDTPYVVNQWWASIVAAKQASKAYRIRLRGHDYPADVEPYSAQGLAAALREIDAEAVDEEPWGGLPTPTLLAAVAGTDATPRLFEAWAHETHAQLDLFERSVECRWRPPVEWWSDMPQRWATTLEPERLDLMTAQLETHAERLEAATGRPLDRARLVEVMRLVNEQEDYYRRTRDLIAATRPAPIGVADSMPATMTPQWHRGSRWARDAARRLFEEVSARVAADQAACPGERLRLMWVGRGLWSDMGFYQLWEESHGAVFVWSMYLGLAADGYIRDFEGEHDVMRALAARFLTMGDELRMPTWAGAWHVKEALSHGVDGAVAIDDADPLVVEALRRAGVPVCEVAINNMAASGAVAETQITDFIESLANAQAKLQPQENAS